MSYEELKSFYEQNFGLSFLNTNIEERLAIVGLICNITHKLKQKKPNVTCYQVLMKILDKEPINPSQERFIIGLSIMCEDTMRNCPEFSNFGIEDSKKQIAKIKEIFSKYLPF